MFLKDNKILWRRMAIAALVTSVLVVMGVSFLDQPLLLALRNFDIAPWGLIDKIFDAKVWLIVSAIVAIVFYLKKLEKTKPCFKNAKNKFSLVVFVRDFIEKTKTSYAFFIFCAVFGACAVTEVLKFAFGRMRPVFFEALGMTGFYPGRLGWEFHSMPSGHAAASFAGLVMIGLLAPRVKWATWTIAIIIGISRVCVGAHWPSDVLFGAFIGMVAADIAKSYISRRG